MSRETKALYAGSFDPPTNGHEWVIRAGHRAFPKGFEVQVGVNPGKNYMFTVEERIALLEKIVAPIGSIAVSSLDKGFTIDYAYKNGFTHMVKGIRDADDFKYERDQDNASQLYLQKVIARDRDNGLIDPTEDDPTVDPIPFFSPPHLQAVSSSFIRGLVKVDGWEMVAPDLVHPAVMEALQEKLSRR